MFAGQSLDWELVADTGQCKDGAQTRHYPRPPCHRSHSGDPDLVALGILSYVRQVLGEPGVWSALSFFGGNAGKRSTDETQV